MKRIINNINKQYKEVLYLYHIKNYIYKII